MDKLIITILILFISGCSSKKTQKIDGVERIFVDVHNISLNASSFMEKIEIVPLETNDSSFVNAFKKTTYDREMDMYAIYGKDQVVYTFKGDGSFIANSKKVQGEGPKEYHMAVDIKFNPYQKGIDLLDPYGKIYTYSPAFDLISLKEIEPEFFFDALMALDTCCYIFTTPAIWTNQEVTLVNLETKQQSIAKYDGMISSGNTMDKECFYKNGSKFYFVPKGVNYYFYEIDQKKKELNPIIYLDFGDSEISVEGLPGCATGGRTGTEKGKTDDKRDYFMKGMQERSQYLRESNVIVPLIKFFNEDFVYIHFKKGLNGYGGHYIYNRKKKKGFLLNERKPFFMQPCFGVVDNILIAICDACYVSRLVDINLMSPDEIRKMEQLKEEDNPVILKYYLQR